MDLISLRVFIANPTETDKREIHIIQKTCAEISFVDSSPIEKKNWIIYKIRQKEKSGSHHTVKNLNHFKGREYNNVFVK